ncbi:hypothetical protein [Flavilitoribacter nigricans]|uniref:Uncharacterized protein n=1 Tax=Flavilitoribacter nigricans (strain ATCC 23147 / DSM 23189 / NBRC 102662 / NCIMB 1420 / SS-2) TaxID=1122177 RepID=A0A2D0N6R2_FLAN2|nr:hypothetical protein [Flavilitoribacter nigricans]PHN04078.1 hypothetical protein CRP01_23050 [Flavilitoribacter nigricans DSM 23189 = NBRC 102662]
MKNANFKNLLKYCFNELPADQCRSIEEELIRDEATFSAISGINLLKRKLGSRQAVEQYLYQKGEQSRNRLLSENRSRIFRNTH